MTLGWWIRGLAGGALALSVLALAIRLSNDGLEGDGLGLMFAVVLSALLTMGLGQIVMDVQGIRRSLDEAASLVAPVTVQRGE